MGGKGGATPGAPLGGNGGAKGGRAVSRVSKQDDTMERRHTRAVARWGTEAHRRAHSWRGRATKVLWSKAKASWRGAATGLVRCCDLINDVLGFVVS